LTVKAESAVNNPEPVNVNVPFFVAFPKVAVAPNAIEFVIVLAAVESLDTTPPETVSVPVPRAASLPT
jgi:hypothetical protein